ncbi:MAG: DUF255 domain-containing protein [Vicinamibacterales bacterium]
MADIHWFPWSAVPFARARAGRKPVLLSIVTGWSGACRAMDDTSYADPAVVAVVNDRFIPVRVDADRRPDISERYSLGGWPTTAFLTSEGALVGGGTFVPQDRFADVLSRAADTFATRADGLATAGPRPVSEAATLPGGAPSDDDVLHAVLAGFDAAHGGFGTAPKFPLAAPVRLMLQRHQDDPRDETLEVVTRSLDAMGWSGLYDEAGGGFYRCTSDAAWLEPQREKLLEVNAALIDLYVEAAHLLGVQRYADRARDALTYVQNWLAEPVDGGWGGCELAASGDEPEGEASPRVDRTLFSGWNGSMVSTALHVAHAFEDDALGRFALTSLERVLAIAYRPGQGMAHYVERQARVGSFLDDQFQVAAGCLDAHDATGNIVYEMMAQELALYAVRALWSAEHGAFVDRVAGEGAERLGRLAEPLVPFVANCDAATVLHRLAGVTNNRDFARTADTVLAAMAPRAMDHGPAAAHYLLARRAARTR